MFLKLKTMIFHHNSIKVKTSLLGSFSGLNREISELNGKGHEPSRAENCSARALAWATSARTHHYRLPLCLCWCKKTFLQNLRDTRGICKIKDQWLANAAMASPKNESGFAIHINDSDQVGSVKVKYLCPCHLLIRGRPAIVCWSKIQTILDYEHECTM